MDTRFSPIFLLLLLLLICLRDGRAQDQEALIRAFPVVVTDTVPDGTYVQPYYFKNEVLQPHIGNHVFIYYDTLGAIRLTIITTERLERKNPDCNCPSYYPEICHSECNLIQYKYCYYDSSHNLAGVIVTSQVLKEKVEENNGFALLQNDTSRFQSKIVFYKYNKKNQHIATAVYQRVPERDQTTGNYKEKPYILMFLFDVKNQLCWHNNIDRPSMNATVRLDIEMGDTQNLHAREYIHNLEIFIEKKIRKKEFSIVYFPE